MYFFLNYNPICHSFERNNYETIFNELTFLVSFEIFNERFEGHAISKS